MPLIYWMRDTPFQSLNAQRYILRVRNMSTAVAQAYYDRREALGFPMLQASSKTKAGVAE